MGQGCKPYYIETLIKAGADVNAKDDKGETPLHYVTGKDYEGIETVVEAIIGAGADINQIDAE